MSSVLSTRMEISSAWLRGRKATRRGKVDAQVNKRSLNAFNSYVTLVPTNPTGDFTLVIETMTHDSSVCIRPALPPFSVKPQTVSYNITGGLKANVPLKVQHAHACQTSGFTQFHRCGERCLNPPKSMGTGLPNWRTFSLRMGLLHWYLGLTWWSQSPLSILAERENCLFPLLQQLSPFRIMITSTAIF